MTPDDVTALEAILNFLSTVPPFTAVLLLLGAVFAWRLMKGGSVKEVLGITNGYVREKEFREDMREIKADIKALRGGVQDIDRKVAGLEAQVEQFRAK